MSRPFWWTRECEDETNAPAEDELADEEADRVERDLMREW